MAFSDIATPFELLVDTVGRKPANAHLFGIFRIEVTEQIVLSADRNRCPVSVGILLRFMDFVFGDIRFESLGVFFRPVRMFIRCRFSGRFRAFVDRRSNGFKVADAVGADCVSSER